MTHSRAVTSVLHAMLHATCYMMLHATCIDCILIVVIDAAYTGEKFDEKYESGGPRILLSQQC